MTDVSSKTHFQSIAKDLHPFILFHYKINLSTFQILRLFRAEDISVLFLKDSLYGF